MVEIGNGFLRSVNNYLLTRYACYLIAQNGDPLREEIAFAQAYFAVQARRQELIEEKLCSLQRYGAFEKLTASQKLLSQNNYHRCVDDEVFGRIHSGGDKALFDMPTKEIKKKGC